VGTKAELGQQTLEAREVNWINGRAPTKALPVQIKIRYKAKPVNGTVEATGDGRARCTFDEPVFGITAGQAAVFYDGDTVLGGGIIAEAENQDQPADNGRLEVIPLRMTTKGAV
jgi:tRNA-specific 2-thiouridylase